MKLRELEHHYVFWCEAHATVHDWPKEGWTFSGTLDRPSFSPSLRLLARTNEIYCHVSINDGQITYHQDNPYELRGTRPLLDLPE